MTRTTNARIAGFTHLFYMAVGLSSVLLFNYAKSAEGVAATLAHISMHASAMRVAILFELLECFSAVMLGVALYGVTRDEDNELAMLALACRVGEGVLGAIGIPNALRLLWLATAGAGAGSDVITTNALGTFLLMPVQAALIGGPFFAVGSMLFSYLLLRGRLVPAPLARLGVLASALLVVGLPLQLVGFLKGAVTGYMWLPMFMFVVLIGLWLLIKGVASPATR